MRTRRPPAAWALVAAGLVAACADESSESESSRRAAKSSAAARAAAATERAAAQPAAKAPPPAAALEGSVRALDAVVSGRTARQWLAAIAEERDQGSAAARAARAALGADRDGAVAALLALLAESPGDGWTGVRALAQDLRDSLVPGLVALLANADPAVASAAFAELRRMAKSGGFGPHDELVVAALVADGIDASDRDVLLAMGPGARTAMPAIAKLLLDDPSAMPSYFALLRGLGPAAGDARGAVLAFLAEKDLGAKYDWRQRGREGEALAALAAMGPDADGSAAAAVERLLLSRHNPVWTGPIARAVVALGNADAAAAELLRRLREGTSQERLYAVVALGQLVPPPRGAVGAVAPLAQDADPALRMNAVWTLAAWAWDDAEALGVLVRAAETAPRNDPESAGNEAVWALLYSGDGRRGTALDAALASPSPDVRLAAIRLVPSIAAWIPLQGARYLRRLRVLASDGDAATAAAARAAVDAMERDEKDRAIATDFVARLSGWDAADRARAAAELQESEVASVVQGLAALLSDKQAWIRYGGAMGLEALGGRAAPAIPALAARLEDGKLRGPELEHVARALGAIGGAGVGLLRAQVRLRGEIAELQAGIARLPESAAGAMLEALSDPDDDVRAAFIRGLGRFVERRDAVRTRAREMLHDASAMVRVAAAGALLGMDATETEGLSVIASVLHGEIGAGDPVLADAVWETSRLGAGATPLMTDLVRVLRSPVACTTWSDAARAVQQCGAAAAPAVTALAAGLDGRVVCADEYCYHPIPPPRAAAAALAALGPVAAPARASLERAARSNDPEVRDLARRALSFFEEKRASVADR